MLYIVLEIPPSEVEYLIADVGTIICGEAMLDTYQPENHMIRYLCRVNDYFFMFYPRWRAFAVR